MTEATAAGAGLDGEPITAEIAATAIRSCFPKLAGRPVVPVGRGWDFAAFRVGTSRCARFPLHAGAERLLATEVDHLPGIDARLSIRTPAPLHLAAPSGAFPRAWCIGQWIEGETADATPPEVASVAEVTGVLRELHRPAPDDAPFNPHRSVPLRERNDAVLERLGQVDDPDSLLAVWRAGRDAAPPPRRTWVHGDLHPGNVVVLDGRVVGILDWGDLCQGDPATDLAALLMLYDPATATEALRRYRGDAGLLARARAWAVFFGVVLATSEPARGRRLGASILARVRS